MSTLLKQNLMATPPQVRCEQSFMVFKDKYKIDNTACKQLLIVNIVRIALAHYELIKFSKP